MQVHELPGSRKPEKQSGPMGGLTYQLRQAAVKSPLRRRQPLKPL
jgi:hypothetical protein